MCCSFQLLQYVWFRDGFSKIWSFKIRTRRTFFFLFSNHRKELGLRKLWFKKMSWACDPLWNWYNLWLYFWICLICPHFRVFFLFFFGFTLFSKTTEHNYDFDLCVALTFSFYMKRWIRWAFAALASVFRGCFLGFLLKLVALRESKVGRLNILTKNPNRFT